MPNHSYKWELLRTLYTGIVEPHFRYCCSVWGCTGSTEINRLQKLQNRAARIVTNSSYDTPVRPLIEALGWETIQELVKNDCGTMVFKSLNGLAPQYLSSLFTRNSACSSRILRNANTDLRLPLKEPQTVKNVFLSEERSYGIASQLSQSKHPPLAYLSRRYRVSSFFF